MAKEVVNHLPMLRNSERSSYKRCRLRWHFAWNMQLAPTYTATPLRFGTLVHDALAAFYIPGSTRGPRPAQTFATIYDEEVELTGGEMFPSRDEEDEWTDARELGIAMLDNYYLRYGEDADFEVIAPEVPFQIPIRDKSKKRVLLVAVGTFDAIVRKKSTGKLYLLEHKTAKTINTRHLQLDEQANTYWALAGPWLRKQGVLSKGDDIAGIIYNFLRKAKPDDRPRNAEGYHLNKDGTVSKRQPSPYFERLPVYRDAADRAQLIDRIRSEAREMRLVRAGKLDVYKNPTRDCAWDCGFYDVCELHEAGADYETMLQMSTVPWDPYASHTGWNDPPGI